MKIAVLFNGNIRTFDKCNENILKTFQKFNVDYFSSTYDKKWGFHPYLQETLNVRDDPILSEDHIMQLYENFNLKNILIDNFDCWEEFYEKEHTSFHEKMQDIKSCYTQYTKIQRGLALIEDYEKEHNFKYDIIVKTRHDFIHNDINNVNINHLKNNVIISTQLLHPNDVIFISSRDNIFKMVSDIISEFYLFSNPLSREKPPHGLLEYSVLKNNLNFDVQNIMQNFVRT